MTAWDFVVAWLALAVAGSALVLAILTPGAGAFGLLLLSRPRRRPRARERPERWIRSRKRGKAHRLRGAPTAMNARVWCGPWVSRSDYEDAGVPEAEDRCKHCKRAHRAVEGERLILPGPWPGPPPAPSMRPRPWVDPPPPGPRPRPEPRALLCARCGTIHPPLERRRWWWPSRRCPTGGCPLPKPRKPDGGG